MTVDTQKLRELLEKATPGPWVAKDSRGAGLEIYADVGTQMRGERHDWPFFSTGNADVKHSLIAYEQWVQFPSEKLNNIQAWNAAYIAAANPATVSALLDEIDMQREIDARNASLDKECGRLERENDALREALGLALKYWADRQQRYKNRSPVWVEKARAVLSPPAPPQGEKHDH